MAKNILIEALRNNDKTGHLFESNGTFIAYKTGFPALDYAMGFTVNVFDSDNNLQQTYPALGITTGSIVTIIGKTHVGKAMPIGTKIPTPNGMVELGSLKVGDFVFNRFGEPVNVLGIYDQGMLPMYKVTFDDGRTTLCNDEHLWSYYNSKGELVTTSLREMIDSGVYDTLEGYKYRIPISEAVQYNEKVFDIDPDEYGKKIGKEFVENTLDITEFDRSYLYGSIPQRWSLLNSICNYIDFYTHTNRGVIELIVDDHSGLANIICELSRSLGIKSELIDLHDNSFRIVMYITHQLVSNIDILSDYKIEFNIPTSRISYIINIESLGYNAEMRCIYVEDVEHLYLANDYIVTHNTTAAIQMASNIVRPFQNGSVIHYDLEGGTNTSRTSVLSRFYPSEIKAGKYILRQQGSSIEEMKLSIAKLYLEKTSKPDVYKYDTGKLDEFGDKIYAYEPTCIIIDSVASMTTIINENTKDGIKTLEEISTQTDKMRLTAEIGRFFTESIPMLKAANIIVFLINHIKTKPGMGVPQAPELRYLKQDETLPCGKAIQYYTNTLIRLTGIGAEKYTVEEHNFNGFGVQAQFIKNRSNADGTIVPLVFDKVHGYDSLRSSFKYAKDMGMLLGNKNGFYFEDDKEHKFKFTTMHEEFKENRELYKVLYGHIIPELEKTLSSVKPEELSIVEEEYDY